MVLQRSRRKRGRRRMAEYKNKEITLEGKTLKWMVKEYGEPPNMVEVSDLHARWRRAHRQSMIASGRIRSDSTNRKKAITSPPGLRLTHGTMASRSHRPLFQQLIEDFGSSAMLTRTRFTSWDTRRAVMGFGNSPSNGGSLRRRHDGRASQRDHPGGGATFPLPYSWAMTQPSNEIKKPSKSELKKLQASDPEGYFSRIYEGLGHWMNKRDAEALHGWHNLT